MNDHYLYLIINLATVFFPLMFSFEKRVAFFRWWKRLLPAMLITAMVFIVWDQFFTVRGVWGFSDQYTIGITIGKLPVEEILFFFTIPYASIFIYAFLNTLYPSAAIFDRWSRVITGVLLVLAMVLFAIYHDRAYTALNCGYAAVLLALQMFVIRGNYMGWFYRFYLWHLIPFFIVNGILTGTGLEQPVVWYNNAENLGIRLGTIPAEDLFYSMSLMLMTITLFEWWRKKDISVQLKK